MEIKITRTDFSPVSTIGELTIDGEFQCFTLEDTVREDGIKIYGETAIPAGTYRVDLTHSPRFRKVLPLLVDVENFTGVRIHPGNTSADTEGCVLVGLSKSEDFIGNSREAFADLMARLERAWRAQEPIELEIV